MKEIRQGMKKLCPMLRFFTIFTSYLTLSKVNLKVNARFRYGGVKHSCQGVLCANMKGIHQGMKKLCPTLRFFDNFYKLFDLEKVNLKVKARFGYGGVKHSCQEVIILENTTLVPV